MPRAVGNPIEDLQVTLERAGRRCTVFGTELVEVLGSPGTVLRLAALLYARSRPDPGREGKGVEGATRQEETNERNGDRDIYPGRSFRDGGSQGEGNATCGQPAAVEQTASYLAEKLDDSKSLAFFRRVARVVPAEDIRDALVAALDLRPSDVRRSRAAYFTSLVMPHLRRCEPKP